MDRRTLEEAEEIIAESKWVVRGTYESSHFGDPEYDRKHAIRCVREIMKDWEITPEDLKQEQEEV